MGRRACREERRRLRPRAARHRSMGIAGSVARGDGALAGSTRGRRDRGVPVGETPDRLAACATALRALRYTLRSGDINPTWPGAWGSSHARSPRATRRSGDAVRASAALDAVGDVWDVTGRSGRSFELSSHLVRQHSACRVFRRDSWIPGLQRRDSRNRSATPCFTARRFAASCVAWCRT